MAGISGDGGQDMQQSVETAFKAQEQLAGYEARFDLAQAAMRGAASVWIIGVFGGLSISAEHLPFRLDDSELGVFILLLGSLGIFMLWLMDQAVYQRLLQSCFVYGLYLEHQNPVLPQLRAALLANAGRVPEKILVFYAAPIIAFAGATFYLQYIDALSWAPWVATASLWAMGLEAAIILFMIGYTLFYNHPERVARPYGETLIRHMRQVARQRHPIIIAAASPAPASMSTVAGAVGPTAVAGTQPTRWQSPHGA
ncbi:MAG: hypothetical protein ABWY00_07515 [Dongiaceae bacterium]